jgi:ADP-glucose pyrophosphorylase
MGIYVFETKFLFDQLRRDAETPIRSAISATTSSPTS